MSLVRFAGFDPSEDRERPHSNVLPLFRSGMDTFALAKYYNTNEAMTLRWVNEERSRLLKKRSPYRETDNVE